MTPYSCHGNLAIICILSLQVISFNKIHDSICHLDWYQSAIFCPLAHGLSVVNIKGQMNQKLGYFLLLLYLHQTLTRTIISEIWVKLFRSKPLEKVKRSKSEHFRSLHENVSQMAARLTGDVNVGPSGHHLFAARCLHRILFLFPFFVAFALVLLFFNFEHGS